MVSLERARRSGQSLLPECGAGRGWAALRRKPDTLQIGPSRMHRTGRGLVIDVDEWGAPPMVGPMVRPVVGWVRGRVRGVVVTPRAVSEVEVVLNAAGVHIWRPIALLADISVDLSPGSA